MSAGTVRAEGLRWANPFYTTKRVSLRIRNFESSRLKVNDNEGNPIEIAAVVVWRVVDTAEAVLAAHPGVQAVHSVRMRWVVHRLHADAELDVDPDLTLASAHRIAQDAEHELSQAVPKLTTALIHAYPAEHATIGQL